jgi:hypothetical protein
MPVTTIHASPAPTGAPRGPPATLPTCGAVPINAALRPGVKVLFAGARPSPESVTGSVGTGGRVPRNQRSGRSGTSGRVTSESVPGSGRNTQCESAEPLGPPQVSQNGGQNEENERQRDVASLRVGSMSQHGPDHRRDNQTGPVE